MSVTFCNISRCVGHRRDAQWVGEGITFGNNDALRAIAAFESGWCPINATVGGALSAANQEVCGFTPKVIYKEFIYMYKNQ